MIVEIALELEQREQEDPGYKISLSAVAQR